MGEKKRKIEAKVLLGPPKDVWINLLVASYIGPNLALYEMSDPEGEPRVTELHAIIKKRIVSTWDYAVVDPSFTFEAFVMTASTIVMQSYESFVQARMMYLLEHGVPEKPLIVLPN